MAEGGQFASLDAAVVHSDTCGLQRKTSIARRSISIFSRKGTDTPESKPPFIEQAAMQAPKQMTEKQKGWIKRKSVPVDSTPKRKGTILNLVPPAKTIQMTSLEEEMATSPNEEIMSAISGTPTTPASFAWPTSAPEQMPTLWRADSMPLAQRTQSVRQKDRNSRIGVWRNGIVHWDEDARREHTLSRQSSIQAATGLTPLRRVPTERLTRTHTEKPVLSVVIPKTESFVNDTALLTILRPVIRDSLVPVAPANSVPKFLLSSPIGSLDESRDVAPLTTLSANVRPSLARKRVSAPARVSGISRPNQQIRKLSSSSNSSLEEDDDSDLSRGSSATSLETLTARTTPERQNGHDRKANVAPIIIKSEGNRSSLDKPLPPHPIPPSTRTAPPVPLPLMNSPQITRSSSRSAQGICKVTTDFERMPSSRSLPQLDRIEADFVRSAQAPIFIPGPSTPTLSEAEDDLESQLSNLSTPDLRQARMNDDYSEEAILHSEVQRSGKPTETEVQTVTRQDSVHSVMHPPERAPTIPKRSRKRDWRVSRNNNRAVQVSIRTARRRRSDPNLRKIGAMPSDCSALRRSPSAMELTLRSDIAKLRETPIARLLPVTPSIVVDEGLVVLNGPVKVQSQKLPTEVCLSSSAAEDVLLHILASLSSTLDLFNTAMVSKGMYRVYKENELDLIQTVIHNQSPAAWEFREWTAPNHAAQRQSSKPAEQTAKSYMDAHRRDMVVIEALKKLILERCQTVIRRETAFALSTPTHPNAQRFNDAFWRIWCFCAIFGSAKGREEDVTGQVDWLKGGLLATNQDLTATMNINLDYEMISVLLNPPDYFAKGNEGGLNSQQLYDMIEIWTCMKTLLEGYFYRTEQAWVSGIFENCGIGIGDDETEAELLEEWIAYLLTLGPKVVLEMAEFANDDSSAGFALAKVNGWGSWTPLANSNSRRDFLKEPVSRLYEERVAAAAMKLQNPRDQEKKEMSRKRVATLAAEIKLARQSSSFRRRPYIDMNMERTMSAFSRRNSTASITSTSSQGLVSPMSGQGSATSRRTTTPLPASRPYNFSMPRPQSPATLWSARKISPIIEDRVETFNRMSLQNFGTGVAEDTVERAVKRVVDMGFSASQARQALMMTDMGDGLRVDRAVDMLLRQRA